MADNNLVRVAGGWLKWDKEHHKWENIEESAASKNHVLKVGAFTIFYYNSRATA